MTKNPGLRVEMLTPTRLQIELNGTGQQVIEMMAGMIDDFCTKARMPSTLFLLNLHTMLELIEDMRISKNESAN